MSNWIEKIELNVTDIPDHKMDDLLNWCMDADNEGSHYFGMTYEQGIRDTLDWLSGETDTGPHEQG
jgi:hypothetical protein